MTDPPAPPGQIINDGSGRIFPCDECGADLVFHIGEQKLKCPYCSAVKEIDISEDAEITEQDFELTLKQIQEQKVEGSKQETDHNEVRCESCGSNVVFDGTLTSTECPYCGSPLQRENVHRGGFRIPVEAVLPFKVDQRLAEDKVAEWVKSRWFAPNEFKKRGAQGKINGCYLPFWTFDTLTFTIYKGERGEDKTETVGSGDDERQVTRTDWYPASGRFQRFFDDILINGTKNLSETHVNSLSPWPLHDCFPFTQEVLAGHFARTYDLELSDAFPIAKKLMDAKLLTDTKKRIGGDKQRVHWVKSRYDEITFKHILLPVYMLAYRYHDKSYQVFVNAATGTVHGDRPYSWVKITLTVLAGISVALLFAMLAKS